VASVNGLDAGTLTQDVYACALLLAR